MSKNTREDSPPLCPYCESASDCGHLLLVVDATFRTAVGGRLFEAFNDRWAAFFDADDAVPEFDEAAEFDALLATVDGLADASGEYEIEGGPGMSSTYLAFYVATNSKLLSACTEFGLRKRPVFQVSWADEDIVLELTLSDRNWTRLNRGKSVSVRGKGYHYEGDFFWDYWDFIGGKDGDLVVRYGSPKSGDYSAQGFVGKVSQAVK